MPYKDKEKNKECIEKWRAEHPTYMKEYRQRPDVKKRTQEYEKLPRIRKGRYKYMKGWREINQEKIKDYNKKYSKEYYRKNKEEINQSNNQNHYKMNEAENKRRKRLGLPLIGEGFKAEMELLVYVHRLFWNYDILTHHRKPLMDWKPCGLELDIYIPKLKLAFEYMGEQHYKFTTFFNKTKESFEAQRYRDICKKKICKLKGIKLIRIKYNERLSKQLILTKLKHLPLISVQKR